MARELNLLEPGFESDVRKLLELCEKDGYPMKPFYTRRTVYEQAKLYRQSRPFSEIQRAHGYLIEKGAPFLASVLMDVGPCNGNWATNALPGFSWHQHGEAVDCYWLLDGKAEWSTKKIHGRENGYTVYARRALSLGLEPGHFWTHKDSVHVQKNNNSIKNLLNMGALTFSALDETMKEKFNN